LWEWFEIQECCEGKEAQVKREAEMRDVVPSVYQPLEAHGYGPHQLSEMMRYFEQMRQAR
jgi:uncharacterized protein (UPF0297 family)